MHVVRAHDAVGVAIPTNAGGSVTAIAWDGNTLASDRRAVSGNGFYTITKIARCGESLVGVSGRGDMIREFQAWIADGRNPEAYPKRDKEECHFTAMVVAPTGTVERFEGSPTPIIVGDVAHAIGCGGIVARAAMHLGCDARKAVEVACLFDENCGNGIDTLTFGDQ
jgi:hypothetical protein